MTLSKDGWSWFDSEQSLDSGSGCSQENGIQIALAFSHLFNSAHGGVVLEHLKSITLGRSFGPSVPDALLRHVEGQRHLVTYILNLVNRGEQS